MAPKTKTPAKTTATAKKVAKKTTAPVDVPPPPPAPEPVSQDAAAEVSAGQELTAAFTEFMARLTQMRSTMSTLLTDFRALQKRAEREMKQAQKNGQKRKRKSGNRAPSGFVKPTLISDQLADFLNKPRGSELARTDVTREINAYIRANNLQDKDNGRKINPDTKLKKLLAIKPSDELTYFNLQRYMSPHFQKASQSMPAAMMPNGGN